MVLIMEESRATITIMLVLCLVLSTLSFPLVSASSELWSQTYGGPEGEYAHSLIETSDGGYAIAGNWMLVKTDMYGNMEWNQTYPGVPRSLVETSDGGYAFAGYTSFDGGGGTDCWLVKTDAYVNMEWNQTYGGESGDKAYSLVATSDGGYA